MTLSAREPNLARKSIQEVQTMARAKSRSQLKTELDNANEYIEELESKLDSIAGIASGEEEEEEEEADS
jgi:hypothetical protein